MRVYICTDMEGLAGVDHWDQCYAVDDHDPAYLHGRRQLTLDTNAAVAGAFDAGAERVFLLDGHGRNAGRGFVEGLLDPRATPVRFSQVDPLRLEAVDETLAAVAVVGQHAMAGTLHGFLDHTEQPKEVCKFSINGLEQGELGMLGLYAGSYGVPLVYASGDEALCEEARRTICGCVTTATKRGTGWASCELYDPAEVRRLIRRDIAEALANRDRVEPMRMGTPAEVQIEWAWSGLADGLTLAAGAYEACGGAGVCEVQRPDARTTRWRIQDIRDCLSWPSAT